MHEESAWGGVQETACSAALSKTIATGTAVFVAVAISGGHFVRATDLKQA
jgi:hypothetical protein